MKETRICYGPLCNGIEKPVSEFYLRPSGKPRGDQCKLCEIEKQKERCGTEGRKQTMFKYRVKAEHGLTPEEHCILFEEHNNQCDTCGFHKSEGRLVIDHCHIIGEIRGILCDRCNAALGKFNDSIECIKSAIEYLRMFQ